MKHISAVVVLASAACVVNAPTEGSEDSGSTGVELRTSVIEEPIEIPEDLQDECFPDAAPGLMMWVPVGDLVEIELVPGEYTGLGFDLCGGVELPPVIGTFMGEELDPTPFVLDGSEVQVPPGAQSLSLTAETLDGNPVLIEAYTVTESGDRGVMPDWPPPEDDFDLTCGNYLFEIGQGKDEKFELEELWKKEAKQWDKSGDPALDKALDYDKVMAEIKLKEHLQARLVERLNLLAIRWLKEHLGLDLQPGEAASGIYIFLRVLKAAAIKGAGGDAVSELKEMWKESCKPKTYNPLFPQRVSKAKAITRFIGKLAFRYPDLVVAGVAGAWAVWDHTAKQKELKEKLAQVRRAIRVEYLQVNEAKGETELWISDKGLPPDVLKLAVPPPAGVKQPCMMSTMTQYIYRDTKSGEIKRDPMQQHPMKYDKKTKTFETGMFTLPDKGCNAVLRIEQWLVCDPEPPKSRLVHSYLNPVRTTKKCPKHGLIRDDIVIGD